VIVLPNLCGTYYYIFLPKPNGSVFEKILPRTVHRKEMLLSADADEGQYLDILTFQMIFANLITTFIDAEHLKRIAKTSGSPVP